MPDKQKKATKVDSQKQVKDMTVEEILAYKKEREGKLTPEESLILRRKMAKREYLQQFRIGKKG